MSMRRVGGILAGVGIASLLLQLVGMQLMLLWFLDGAGPKLAVVFKIALVVAGILIWKHADE